MRATDVKDGYALQYALRKGYHVAVISGGYSETMRMRYTSFPGMEIFLKVSDKVQMFNEYLSSHNLTPAEVMFMGDDIPDLELMHRVGCPVCPQDACSEIKEASLYISQYRGGYGCARDVIEQTLKAQDKWLKEENAFGW